MARLRQQHPQNYGSSGNIHTDFESIIRYINSAELGDKTIGELMATLFDAEGNFDGPIKMRLNPTAGLQYRIGEYRNDEDGWQALAAITDIRGPAGLNVGQIEGPLFFNRQDTVVASNGTTDIPYAYNSAEEDILVMKNGLLLRKQGVSPDYTYSAGNVVLASAVNIGAVISIFTIRGSAVSNYRRLDYVSVGTNAVVPFAFTDDERLLVYRNGLLAREGGSYDYVKSSVASTITWLTPLADADVATVITVENQAQVNVAGLMLEDEYTDGNGFINYAKLGIADAQIPQVKVSGLASGLASKAKMTVASSAPVSPDSGDLWLDTSLTPNVLKFYQGTQWLAASPSNILPNFLVSNANQYLRVNGTGTLLEYGNIDFSALVPKTYMGAANGVASLDSTAKIPVGQLPAIYSTGTYTYINGSTVTAVTVFVGVLYRQKIRIDGITAVMGTGTCSIQLAVDGATFGSVYAVSTTRTNQTFAPIEIDATTVGKHLQVVVTSPASTPAGLVVGISYSVVTT